MTNTFHDTGRLAAQANAFAARLCWRLSLPSSDMDDLRQELLADLLRRLDRFDPSRGCLGAFATVVLRNRSARIAERIVAERNKSGGPLLSLDVMVGPEALVETLPEEGDARDGIERRVDAGRVISRLPHRDRALCVAVTRWPVDRLAGAGFGSRATLYRRLRELRFVLAAHGLAA